MNPFQPPSHDGPADQPRSLALDAATAQAIGEKIKRLNRNSLLLGLLGIVVQAATRGSPLIIVGAGLLVYAFSLYARMRNQSPWWGALGLLSCFGLVGLLFLPKKCHFCNATTKGKQCQHCGAPAPL